MKMPVKILAAIFYVLMPLASFAQTFSIKAGHNLSNIATENIDNINTDVLKMRHGFNIGAAINIPINKTFSFETGLFLINKGYSIRMTGSDYYIEYYEDTDLFYLDIPLFAKASYNFDDKKIYGTFGPYIGAGISGKTEYVRSRGGEAYFVKDIIWGSGEDASLKRFDYGFNLGAGIEINSANIGLFYSLGLANISTDPDNESKINNRVFGITIDQKIERGFLNRKKQKERNISISSNTGGFTGDRRGFTFGKTLYSRNNILLLSAEYNLYQEMKIRVMSGAQEDRLHMISIYGGSRLGKRLLMFDAQIGLGLIWSNVKVYEGYRENPVNVFVSRPSYNLKTGIKFALTDKFAIGIDMRASLNDLTSIYTLPLLSIEIGKIR